MYTVTNVGGLPGFICILKSISVFAITTDGPQCFGLVVTIDVVVVSSGLVVSISTGTVVSTSTGVVVVITGDSHCTSFLAILLLESQ